MKDWSFNQKSLLFYMYFGITEEEAKKKPSEAIPFCINIAFRDFQRNLKYQYSESYLNEMKRYDRDFVSLFEKEKVAFRDLMSRKIILSKINELLSKADISDKVFDEWHKETCDVIKSNAEQFVVGSTKLFKNDSFTYGLAQKWLNMSLKNMLVMGAWDMSHIKDSMHIPVDSYIIEAACYHAKDRISELYNLNGLSGVDEPCESWSNIKEYCTYLHFQEQVRDAVRAAKEPKLSPIDWEGMAWIAIAKIKANKG